MSHNLPHIALIRLSALAVVFLVAGTLADALATSHDAPMHSASDAVHADGMQQDRAECTGDGCGQCDESGGTEHFAEHCPDCLAQLPAAPETVRLERRLASVATATIAVNTPGDPAEWRIIHSPPTALSGPSTRSAILRL